MEIRYRGSAGEKIVESDLILKRMLPSVPSISGTVYDLIADDQSGGLYKIQVKTSHSVNGRMKVDIRRPSAKQRHYSDNDYDVLAIVDLQTRKVAYFPKVDIPTGRQLALWTDEPANKSHCNTGIKQRNFDDYLEFPFAKGNESEAI